MVLGAFLVRMLRGEAENALFECWSSVATLGRCMALVLDEGDLTLAKPGSLAAVPALNDELVVVGPGLLVTRGVYGIDRSLMYPELIPAPSFARVPGFRGMGSD